MSVKPLPGFVGPTYQSQSRFIDSEECINLYAEKIDGGADGKAQLVYYGTPGLKMTHDLRFDKSFKGISKLFSVNGHVFATVAGGFGSIYEIFADGTKAGVAGPFSSDIVSIANVATQAVAVAADGTGFVLDLSSGPPYAGTPITSSGYLTTNVIVQIDGYFIGFKPNSTTFFLSANGDGSTWDPLDFANSNGPDNIVTLAADHRQLWIFGTNHTEVWYDSGAADFPLTRIEGAYIEKGCAAAYSVAKCDNSLFWLGADERGAGIVYRTKGYNADRVSTFAMESEISKYSKVSDATAYSYQDKGHEFYRIDFPSGNATWVYDASNGLWHKRQSWNQTTAKYGQHIGATHVYAFGKHLVGDVTAALVHEQNSNYYTDNGAIIRRLRRAPHTAEGGNQIFFNLFRLDIETGEQQVYLTDSAGNPREAQVMLRWSDDGGYTWGNEVWVDAGAPGRYSKLVDWRRLGYSKDRVWEMVITDPVPVVISGAYFDGELGTK